MTEKQIQISLFEQEEKEVMCSKEIIDSGM